jgi:prevent-host-death family protein
VAVSVARDLRFDGCGYDMTACSHMSKTIGIRQMKNEASAVLRRVRGGETVTVTDRGRKVALIVPIVTRPAAVQERLRTLVEGGRIAWAGGKPAGADQAERVRGATVADAVIEDRR